MQHLSHKSIAVIGGGLAGTAAALALAQQGVRVKLIEARRRLGGRAGSFASGDPESDGWTDYCQHVGMGCCTNLKQLIRWLGQEQDWAEYREYHFYSSSGSYRRLTALPFLPAPLHLTGWLLAWPDLGIGDRLAVARGLLALDRLQLAMPLGKQSAIEWLKAHGQTTRGIVHFWNTIVVSALGEDLQRVDLFSLCKVFQDGFLKHRQAFHVLIPQRPLNELFNVQARRRLQEAGVEILAGTPVTAVSRRHEGVVVSTRTADYQADATVIAVPWHSLSRIEGAPSLSRLTDIARRAAELKASPITGLHTWWDGDWLDYPHATIVGRLCQWVFAEPHRARTDQVARPGQDGLHYYQIVISASRMLPTGDPERVKQMLCEDLHAVFPRSKQCTLVRFKQITDPLAVFSVNTESADLRATHDVLGPDVLLAGDWTRTGWPATMEGAVLSGFRAAESLFESWQHPLAVCASPLS